MPNNLKGYDAFQVLRSVFDVDKNCLRVCVVDGTTGGGGGFEVIIDHTNDSIRLGDGTNFISSTTVLGKIGLDVSVINDIDIRQLDASTDNVAIQDAGGDQLEVTDNGGILTNNQDTTIVVMNIPAALANTEYSFNLPTKTKRFVMRSRNRGILQFTNLSGQTNATFMTLKGSAVYTDTNFYENLTLYFRTSKAGDVIEVIAYQ